MMTTVTDIVTIPEVYNRLYEAYRPQHWWPGDSPFEVIVGAILTQNTAWANVEKALANLKAAGALTPQRVDTLSEEELQLLVKPSGFYNGKARKLKAFVDMLFERYDGCLERLFAEPLPELRKLLLHTYGIGPETADSMILYAANKPSFVIDAYTRRIFSRLGRQPESNAYDAWQRLFSEALPLDALLFNEYHALIVQHGKMICRTVPVCRKCCLREICPATLSEALTIVS
jgi:endonuclease-3 related protein